jgi:DNA polymerase-3 subunit alpha
MAALMSSVMNTKDRVPQYVAEARAMKIEVLPPDVNESGRRFTVVGNTIRFGLSAVKNVGENTVEAIQAARKRAAPSPTSSTSASGWTAPPTTSAPSSRS